MAKTQIIAGRRVVAKKPTAKQVEKAHKLPTVRVKERETMSGLSLKQLYNATPPYIKSNASYVVVKSLKEATTKGGLPGIRARTMTMVNKAPQLYETSIIGKEAGIPIVKQKHVLVSCSCDWFWSHCEYALAHWGSAVIKYSNGEPATTTNPQNHPLLCKHLVKLAEVIRREGF